MKNILKSILIVGVVLTFAQLYSCKDDGDGTDPNTPTKNMYELLSADGSYSVMVAAIDKLGLKASLNGTGGVTVLAVSDNVLLADGVDVSAMSAAEVENFVKYHIIPSVMKPANFTHQGYVGTESASGPSGKKVSIYTEVEGDNVRFNGKNYIKKTDATNGVIYDLEASIKPPTVLEALAFNTNIKTYRTAVNLESPIKTDLGAGPNTVFATSETKFIEYLNANNTTITSLTPTLRRVILNNSIIGGSNKTLAELSASEKTKGADLAVTTSGGTVTLNGKSTVQFGNGQCTDGVIHVVSDLLN